jgi:hypothetical protein
MSSEKAVVDNIDFSVIIIININKFAAAAAAAGRALLYASLTRGL